MTSVYPSCAIMCSATMPSCCHPQSYGQIFGARFARRAARRYRRRGLVKTARRTVEYLQDAGVAGATVLEVGGGVGEIQLELLKGGADRTVNLELSPAYEAEAERLLREAGLEGRMLRRLHDIAADPHSVEPADVVVLHRVVCCYPDYEALLAAAASHCRRLLVLTYPRHNGISRSLIAIQNLGLRLLRRDFRAFVHPPPAMLAVLRDHGLEVASAHDGLAWHVTGLARARPLGSIP